MGEGAKVTHHRQFLDRLLEDHLTEKAPQMAACVVVLPIGALTVQYHQNAHPLIDPTTAEIFLELHMPHSEAHYEM